MTTSSGLHPHGPFSWVQNAEATEFSCWEVGQAFLFLSQTHTLTYTRAAAAAVFPLLSWYPSDTKGRKIQTEIGMAKLIKRKCNLQEFPTELTPPLSKLSPPAPSHVCLHIRWAAYLLFHSWGFFKKRRGNKGYLLLQGVSAIHGTLQQF